MYSKIAMDYFKKGIKVVPIQPGTKFCTIKEWNKVNFESCLEDYPGHGVGLDMSSCEIAILDIDVLDTEIQGKIKEYLKNYPSPIQRRGNPNKIPSHFYRKTWQKSKESFAKCELFTAEKDAMIQVVLPPTVHPDFKGVNFEWVTPYNLLNFNLDDLPEFPREAWDGLKELLSSDKLFHEIKSEGRNNKLLSMVTAARAKGKGDIEIVREIVQYDKDNHSPRLFLDKSEKFPGKSEKDAEKNAMKFVTSVTKSLLERGDFEIPDYDGITIDLKNDEALDSNSLAAKARIEMPYPVPEGIMKDIMDYMDSLSYKRTPNLYLGAAISIMSALASNKFKFNNTRPNTYILNLAGTGTGKQAPQDAVVNILADDIDTGLVVGGYKSSSAIVQNLQSKREQLSLIDEIPALFGQIKEGSVNQTEMVDVLCDLWSKSNGRFQNQAAATKVDTGTCFHPHVSILGSGTIEGMKAHSTKLMVTKGLFPRFLCFTQEKHLGRKESKEDLELKKKILAFVRKMQGIKKIEDIKDGENVNTIPGRAITGAKYKARNISYRDEKVEAFFKEKIKPFQDLEDSEHISEAHRNILTRSIEHVNKMALEHCLSRRFGDNFIKGDGEINEKDIQFGYDVVVASNHNGSPLIEMAFSDTTFEKDYMRTLEYLEKAGSKGMTPGVLLDRLRFPTKKFEEVLMYLQVTGKIFKRESEHPRNKTKIRTYFRSSLDL